MIGENQCFTVYVLEKDSTQLQQIATCAYNDTDCIAKYHCSGILQAEGYYDKIGRYNCTAYNYSGGSLVNTYTGDCSGGHSGGAGN